MQRLLLAIIILEIPIQIDAYLFHQEADAAYGAVAGLNLSITTVCLAALYVLWFFERVQQGRSIRPALWISLPATCYVAAVAVSALVAADRALVLFDWFLLMQAFLIYVYVSNRIRSADDVAFVVTVFSVALAMQALLMIGIWAYGDSLSVSVVKATIEHGRTSGTIGSPVPAGSYLTLLLVPVASILFLPLDQWRKLLAGSAISLGVIALVLNQTRGAWIATLLAGTIFMVLVWRRGWMPRWAPRAITIGAVLVGLAGFHVISTRIYGDDNGSAVGRIPLIEMGLRVVSDNPILGVGAGNCHHAVLDEAGAAEFRSEWLYTVHNKYILVAVETGLLGLVFFVWFLVATVRQGWAGWRLANPRISPVALALAAVIAGQMVHMMVDVFNNRPQVQTLWCCAGLIAAISRMDREEA